uniref:Sodium:solute symporter family protein n=1 Tax=Thermosphaera aggregans TaxID=54254 RepID=A0A7C2BKI7_9CREN
MYVWALVVVLSYLLLMLGVGFYAARYKVKTAEDLVIAGRRVGLLLVAASLSANNIGGGSTVGVAARAYGAWGLSAGWYIMTAGVAMIPVGYVFYYMRKTRAWTLPQVISKRFGAPSHLTTSVLQMISLTTLTASQILASGTIFSALTGLPFETGVLLATIITILYTILGGLWADVMTDFVQWLMITLGMLVAIPFILANAGGWESVVARLPAGHLDFFKLGYNNILNLTFMYIVSFITGAEMASRALASRDEKIALKGSILSGVLMAVYAFIPAVMGLVALAELPGINANEAYARVMLGYAPEPIAGIALAAILAATMSSADSDMLGTASIFAVDIWKKYVKKEASDREVLILTRMGVVVVGVLAAAAALTRFDIVTINTFAFMLRSAGPFAPFALGLIMKYVTKEAGIAAIITGSIAGVYWRLAGQPYGIGDTVIGAVVGVVTFLVVIAIGKALGRPPAPPLEEVER